MSIRQATLSDLDRLLALDEEFWKERQVIMDSSCRHTEAPMPRETMAHRVVGEGFRTFVVEPDGDILGYLVAGIQRVALPRNGAEKEGAICDVYVRPEHRRRGIASELYRAASEWFAAEGCDCEKLTVHAGNPASLLYEKWGFTDFSINMRKRI